MLKVGIHSDMHTEFSSCTITNLPELDVLILAGDIGDLFSVRHFLHTVRQEAPCLPILYVLGNHEYYGLEFEQAKEQYRQLCENFQVTLLDNEILQIDDVLFVGSTLWTDFSLAGEPALSMIWANRKVPDFRKISRYTPSHELVAMQPGDTILEFTKACDFIRKSLMQPCEGVRKKVVVSHFLPSVGLLAPGYYETHEAMIRSAYFATDLPCLYALADEWIYGHSHDCIETMTGTTRFLSNQRGYSKTVNQAQSADYRRDYCVEI